MFDPLDEDQKKENMTLDDSLLILANIYFFTKMIQMKLRVRIIMTA